MRRLLEDGAKFEKEPYHAEDKRTSLMLASMSGVVEAVKLLLENEKVSDDDQMLRNMLTQKDFHGRTALMLAIKHGEESPKENPKDSAKKKQK
eukprot:SAG31_NODE_13734_length_850_cov_1.376831_1_plen_92_part_10